MASASYAITGIPTTRGPDGALPLRQEIDTWSANPANVDQVNLYLQALAAFQQLPATDKLSYFQIAGIHGEPFVPWDENTSPNPRTSWRGYCTHASVLFPTWHRPYLAVFEQILHSIMQQIAAAYPDQELRNRYQAAAQTFRIPYWDTAQLKERGGRRSLNVPYLCTLPTVQVFTPTSAGDTVRPFETIDNPLYSYKFVTTQGITSFQDQDGNFFPFANATKTSRYPPEYNSRNPTASSQWANGVVDNDSITEALRNLSSLGEDVYRSFTTSNYVWYSSTQQSNPPAPNSYQSLESIHNEIHGITGGGGHMSWNTVSSFDPIFWLHHCNVDRLFAIWQAIYADTDRYPDAWFNAQSSQLRDERGTWSIAAGTRENADTPLAPFHKDDRGSVYTSNDVRNWTRFGSSYPELQPWLPQYRDSTGEFNATLYRNDVVAQVTDLYSRVRRRVQNTQVPRNRLFAATQTGTQSFQGGSASAGGSFAPPPTTQGPSQQLQFAPPPSGSGQTFAPPPTAQAQAQSQGQPFTPPTTLPTQGQQFSSPPPQTTQGQQFPPPPTQQQQFPPPPTQQQQFSPPPTQQQQFAPPPTQEQAQAVTSPPAQTQFSPPPTQGFSPPPTGETQGQQFAPQPQQQQFAPPQQGPVGHTPQGQHSSPPPKKGGLSGLVSSAKLHFGEALTAGREAAQGHQPVQQQQPPGAPGNPGSSGSALATKFGGIIGGGFHMAQGRLGSKKQPAQPGSRGIDDEPGQEGELSRGFGDMSLGQPGSTSGEPLTYHEYDANIRFERFDLGGRPFTVHIFLGDFNPDPATWMWDKNRVGGIYNFVAGVQRGDGSACSNCETQSQDHTIVTGQVSLTTALLDDIEDPANGLHSLIPEEVIPYLQRHLHWRITDPNGREIPRQGLRTLKISVVECSATISNNPGELTQYGDHRVLDIVTEGRPAGKAAADGY
ncbi:uncharacterized protein DFL_003846 [Arthrobotrys flagrans]|uniref:tyrosinase n=1 Tax=Arthrobotrys flagrans TaxID=97331 RepID=A0A437A308_ARTFL|nr:hypothetical protein DFL_003846 [Arthrobotrys flagrans]